MAAQSQPNTEHQVFVVALDDSEASRRAFEKAIALSRRGEKQIQDDDKLILLHIVEIQKTSLLDPLHEPCTTTIEIIIIIVYFLSYLGKN